MAAIADIIEELVMSAIVTEKVTPSPRTKAAVVLAIVSAFLGALGLLLLVYAAEQYAERIYPPDTAALIAACGAAAAAIAAALGAHYVRRPRITYTNAAPSHPLHELIQTICEELDGPIRENPKMAVLVAALAGFVTSLRKI